MKKTKKALIAAFACAAALAAGATVFTACQNEDTPHDHSWSEWTVADENKPTEQAGGKATRTCSADGCDATDSEKERDLPPLTSTDYTKTEDTATCVAGGSITYTYNHNGVNVSFEVATSKKTEHTWGVWTVEEANKPTEQAGGKATRTCTVTGCTVAADEYDLPALDSEDYQKTEDTATCVAGGTVTYTYNKNNVSVSFTVNTPQKTQHTWGAWTVEEANKPTTEAGGKATRTCTVDGCMQVDEHTLPALNETDYEKSADTATCIAAGTVTYTYEIDGESLEITVATPVNPDAHGALTHHEAEFISCELGGNREYWECPLCEKKFDAEEGGNELTDVTTPSGHNYVITVNSDGTATEACANEGCTTGETKEYKYINDSNAGASDALTAITLGDYYIEKATNGLMWLRLDLTEAAIYKIDFAHLNESGVGAITLVRVDGTNSTANNVITGRSGAVAAAFSNVASHSHVAGKNNQSASFTFDSTNYVGHFLMIQLSVQSQPKIKMSVSKGKAPLKYGANTVNITEANAMFIDTYEFIPTETKSYSMTVPEGVEVLMNNNDFIVGEDRTVNFDGVEGEKIVFAFKNGTAGNVTVTIGDAVEEITLTPDSPVNNFSLTGHDVSVIKVGAIEAGKYTVTIKVSAVLMQTFVCFGNGTSENYSDYFQANGNLAANSPADVNFMGNAMSATVLNNDKVESATFNRTTWTVTLNLQQGDKLVFVNSGNTGLVNISMAAAV